EQTPEVLDDRNVCPLPQETYAQSTLLYKPIDRVTRSTLVLHNFLSSINEEIDPRRTAVTTPKGEARQLVKDGFLVEVSEGSRKLRHVFLFTDLLLCAKMKKTSAGRHQQYECKWYIPLADLTFQLLDDSDVCPHIQVLPEHEIEEMKTKISVIKSEIQKEKKALKGQSRNVERLRKKMNEQESWLLLHSPTIPFRIHNKHGKSYLFLLSSDYERSEWRESIQKLQKKDLQTCQLSSLELQVLTSSCFKLRTVHNIPVTSYKDDEETPGLYGFLHVIVNSAKGFKESANLYCTLEVDSYGYFVSKAKTRVFRDTTEPQWNEEFEIELEGSQCLRILCYEKCYDKTKLNKDDNEIVDIIMGKGQVQKHTVPQAIEMEKCIRLTDLSPTPAEEEWMSEPVSSLIELIRSGTLEGHPVGHSEVKLVCVHVCLPEGESVVFHTPTAHTAVRLNGLAPAQRRLGLEKIEEILMATRLSRGFIPLPAIPNEFFLIRAARSETTLNSTVLQWPELCKYPQCVPLWWI
ncbi:unnamed protein product, partial [Coregonus sp. 'balchen']